MQHSDDDDDSASIEPLQKRAKHAPQRQNQKTGKLADKSNQPKDDIDDEVVFIRTETARCSVKSDPARTSGVTAATVPARKKTSLVLSTSSDIRKRLVLGKHQSSAGATVQKSLKDFFKPRIPSKETFAGSAIKPPSSRSSSASEIVEVKEEVKMEMREEKPVISAVNPASLESGPTSSYFEDDSSGDEMIASIPESLLADSTEISQSFSLISVGNRQKFLRTYTSKVLATKTTTSSEARKCPFYKLLPGTKFSVDAFNFGVIPNVDAYYLSHFHSDHYGGMTKSFSRPLYCSEITARLVAQKIRVDLQWINAIPMNTPVVVDDVELTLLDANHCPGSVLFLFKLKDGRVYLHTGDFRADPAVLGQDPHLKNLREISKVYLDTTYLDPYYEFPSQEETIAFAAEKALEVYQKNPKALFVCGTYSVGKERIFMRIAEVLKCRVAVTQYKLDLLKCFQWDDLDTMLTKDWNTAQIHVLPMRALELASLEDHLAKFKNFTEVVAFVPSGWQFNKKLCSLHDIKPKKRGSVSVYGVPYSEHSSYRELEWFVRFIKPKEIIPTVNVGNPNRRKKMKEYLDMWMDPTSKPIVAKKQNSIKHFFSS